MNGCLVSMRRSKRKNPKWPTKKTPHFPPPSILNICVSKIFWIGPWVSRIGWCKGHWCGSTYLVVRLSNKSSKTQKMHFLPVFELMSDSLTTIYIEPHQCPSHQSILLAQAPIHKIFMKKYWKLAELENVFFLSRPFFFFFLLQKKDFFGSSLWKQAACSYEVSFICWFWWLTWFSAQKNLYVLFCTWLYYLATFAAGAP